MDSVAARFPSTVSASTETKADAAVWRITLADARNGPFASGDSRLADTVNNWQVRPVTSLACDTPSSIRRAVNAGSAGSAPPGSASASLLDVSRLMAASSPA
ncbi:hypothetical protein GC169_05620 [bacterium]|nr:hypothetical protein [bacterium]